MEEIKVGEYVRTKEGIIGKIEQIGNSLYWLEDGSPFNIQENSNKHSRNVIDLIEVGDYVNEYKVLAIEDSIYKNSKRILIYKNEKEKYERWIYIQEYNGEVHTQDDIKTIVTHEQMSNIEYRLEN